MTSVLFIGGVHPNVTQEELQAAFSQHAALLATSVVRTPWDGKCVGQAYVTVAEEDVGRAIQVTEVGSNSVCIFPVDVDAWVAPGSGRPAAVAAAPAGAGPAAGYAAGGVGGWGSPAFSGGSGGAQGGGLAVGQAPGFGPAADHVGTHLKAVLEQMRALIASNPRLTYNGKPYYPVLNEACQRRQLALQVTEAPAPESGSFSCTIAVTSHTNGVVCTGIGTGMSKKDAKHNAAASCLDQMLAAAMVPSNELVAAMTCGAPQLGGAAGAAGGSESYSPAAATAAQTQSIVGPYPRCAELMRQVHSTEQGRVKTVFSVLNEFVTRARLTMNTEEVAPGPGSSGRFRFSTRLVDQSTGQLVAQGTGMERSTKQEAKQSAAAATLQYIMDHNIATLESLARGGK